MTIEPGRLADPGAHAEVLQVHSQQAPEFAAAYEEYERDPYRSCFGYSRMRLRQSLEEHLPQANAGLRALDVGCGTGHYLRLLAQRGFDVTGVDGSAEMLAEAKALHPPLKLHKADVTSLPFPAAHFDLLLCVEVLRYLPDPESCIREMARVLRPGGLCLATAAPLFSVNGYPIVNRLALVAPLHNLVSLKQHFTTPSRLRGQFERSGFTSVDVRGVYTGPINWIEHLAPRRLPAFLHRWESLDRKLSRKSSVRAYSNMLLVVATRMN